MPPFKEQLLTYQQQHTNKINRLTHYIGIPAIVFAILMLLNWISIHIAQKIQFSFSWILLISVLIYYFILNKRLSIAAVIVLIPFTWLATLIARPTPTPIQLMLFLILFFGGWAMQFLGHFFEKQKPAFLLSASQLLIGPLFVIIELLEVLKLQKYFISEQEK